MPPVGLASDFSSGSYSRLEQNVQKIHNTRTLFPDKISFTCQGKGRKVIWSSLILWSISLTLADLSKKLERNSKQRENELSQKKTKWRQYWAQRTLLSLFVGPERWSVLQPWGQQCKEQRRKQNLVREFLWNQAPWLNGLIIQVNAIFKERSLQCYLKSYWP